MISDIREKHISCFTKSSTHELYIAADVSGKGSRAAASEPLLLHGHVGDIMSGEERETTIKQQREMWR